MMIFIRVYAKSFKSIRMLAYRVSFCCCQSKVCSDTFVKKIHRVSYNMGACWNRNVWQQIGYKQYILIVLFTFFVVALNAVHFAYKLRLQTNHHICDNMVDNLNLHRLKSSSYMLNITMTTRAVEIITFDIIIVTMPVCLPEF